MTFPIVLAHGIAPSDRPLRDTVRDGDSSAAATHDFRGTCRTLGGLRFPGRERGESPTALETRIRPVDVAIATDVARRVPKA